LTDGGFWHKPKTFWTNSKDEPIMAAQYA